jgi:NadR type nicotinamide-nucleotide adenylyltransferase
VKRWRTGLIIGKLRPPHLGHCYLIETALEQVDQLTVLICHDASDTIPVELRRAWLTELYPEASLRVVESTGLDADDSQLWADMTIRWLGQRPDVVFTSEPYGDPYSRFLGCDHQCVDLDRSRNPISASLILSDPVRYLTYLPQPVRPYFTPRIAIVGAESTGKTTLAKALAKHYGTTWAPEYGRTYWEGLLTLPRINCSPKDFEHIAAMQLELEDRLARHATGPIICDTDVLSTLIWKERYLGICSPIVEAMIDLRRYRLYILTGAEIPWEDDGTRDGRDIRAWMHDRFVAELTSRGLPFVHLNGPHEARLAEATRHVDVAMKDHATRFR